MKTSDFDYHLPQELIAQTPVEPRDSSRLLVLSRSDGAIQHSRFHDLPRFLRKGDLLVFNDSRVFPARLHGKRLGTDTLVEIFLLTRLESDTWRALVKPGKRLRTGARFLIGDIEGEVLSVEPDGSRTVRLPLDDAQLHALGEVPLPPYIRQPLADPERFQTVYSRVEGSVAAPTAGLHFTPRLLDELRGMGVGLGFVTLHVGWGTFKPIEVENVADHAMHAEAYSLSEDTADAINRAKREGRRVIVVGTTAVRLLESRAAMTPDGTLTPGSGWTDIFITPGHRFRVMDVLITNFHLPKSTLIMLTSAFAGQSPDSVRAEPVEVRAESGRNLILRAYRKAVAQRYRFYSLGDAMFII